MMDSSVEVGSARPDLPTIVIAAAFALPVALPAIFGYETNPAFLLAPLVAYALLSEWRHSTALLFLLSGIGGLASIFIAAYFYPDGRFDKNILSLALMMFSAGFLFLGQRIPNTVVLVRWLALFSILFVVAVSARLIILGEFVRSYILPEGFSILNAKFFGMPVFATFGVNALAHLICIQAALICGAAFNRDLRPHQVMTFILGFAACSFLIVGSDSRSSQIFLFALVASLVLYALRHRIWRVAVVLLAMSLIGGIGGWLKTPVFRLVDSAGTILEATAKSVDSTSVNSPSMNSVSTGRIALAQAALREIKESPLVGSGFSPFGRYSSVSDKIRDPGTHIYYLTALWKGGLLFALPFYAFLGAAAISMLRQHPWRDSSEEAFAAVAVVLMFGWLAFTYDTPTVPSAGALAFLLLGSLGRKRGPTTQYPTIAG